MSPEVQKFIEDNIALIDADNWQEVLYRATKMKKPLIAELIYFVVSSEVEDDSTKTPHTMTLGLGMALNKIIGNYEVLESVIKSMKE